MDDEVARSRAGVSDREARPKAPRLEKRRRGPSETRVVGRGRRCDLVLKRGRVSRRHCKLVPVGDGYLLRDLGSQNGTWVEGERIEQAFLPRGSRFVVGNVMLEILDNGALREVIVYTGAKRHLNTPLEDESDLEEEIDGEDGSDGFEENAEERDSAEEDAAEAYADATTGASDLDRSERSSWVEFGVPPHDEGATPSAIPASAAVAVPPPPSPESEANPATTSLAPWPSARTSRWVSSALLVSVGIGVGYALAEWRRAPARSVAPSSLRRIQVSASGSGDSVRVLEPIRFEYSPLL
ncbi:MAG: FHA domain-containing protein, partial [Planctomycetes bacterium]|nr:FHA domain-containing protein [Planctomycetota bacterium]